MQMNEECELFINISKNNLKRALVSGSNKAFVSKECLLSCRHSNLLTSGYKMSFCTSYKRNSSESEMPIQSYYVNQNA